MDETGEFSKAIEGGDLSALRRLLDASPDLVNTSLADGLSPVLVALYAGQSAAADLLIASGAVLDIFTASAAGQDARVAALLDENPARVNAFATDGFTPLCLAAFFGRLSTCQLLLARGADANLMSGHPSRVRPLHSAAASRQMEIAELLLQADADPNLRQLGGFVPLHAAAELGQVEMADLLLHYGADPTLANDAGQTALDFAMMRGHTELVRLFKTHANQ
jgi:uncharacterized protein